MPRYNVTMPLAGSITFYGIEADNEDDAIAATFEVDVDVSFKAGNDEPVYVELDEVEWMRHMSSGNVNYFRLNDAYADLEEDPDGDAG